MFKDTTTPQAIQKLKGTQGYTLKHFTFYYDNIYPIHKEAKYGISYWLQELHPRQFKGTDKKDNLYNNNLKGDTFSNTKNIRVKFFAIQAGINIDLA